MKVVGRAAVLRAAQRRDRQELRPRPGQPGRGRRPDRRGHARGRHPDRVLRGVVRRARPHGPAVTRDGGGGVGRPLRPRLRARIPFRLKVAAVWLVSSAWSACCSTSPTTTPRGCATTPGSSSTGIRYTHADGARWHRPRDVLATLGALARLSSNPVLYGVSGFYVSFFRGTPLIVQMFLIYLALPQIGEQPGRPVPEPRHQRRAAAHPRGGARRHDRPRSQLRRLHDRDLPGRHPVGGPRPG